MNHKMKNIAVAMFAALLLVLSTAVIGSGHIALTYNKFYKSVFK